MNTLLPQIRNDKSSTCDAELKSFYVVAVVESYVFLTGSSFILQFYFNDIEIVSLLVRVGHQSLKNTVETWLDGQEEGKRYFLSILPHCCGQAGLSKTWRF